MHLLLEMYQCWITEVVTQLRPSLRTKDMATRSKGIATRSKDATRGSWPYY